MAWTTKLPLIKVHLVCCRQRRACTWLRSRLHPWLFTWRPRQRKGDLANWRSPGDCTRYWWDFGFRGAIVQRFLSAVLCKLSSLSFCRKLWVSWSMTATCSTTTWVFGLFLWIELGSGSLGHSTMWPLSRVTQVGSHFLPLKRFTQTWKNMTHQRCPTAVERNGESLEEVYNSVITDNKDTYIQCWYIDPVMLLLLILLFWRNVCLNCLWLL